MVDNKTDTVFCQYCVNSGVQTPRDFTHLTSTIVSEQYSSIDLNAALYTKRDVTQMLQMVVMDEYQPSLLYARRNFIQYTTVR